MAFSVVAADKLAAIVGVPDQITERNAVALEMLLDAGGEQGAGSGRTALGKSQEEQAAADLAGGVFDGREIKGLGLGPVVGNIVEVFGVGGDLLEEAPRGFNVSQVLLPLIFSAAGMKQAVSPPDTLQSAVAEREIELANETASPEGVQLLAENHDLRLDSRGSFAGLVMRSARKFDEATGPVLLIAAQPFAHGGNGGLKQAGGGLDAMLAGVSHQTQAMVVSVLHFPHPGEVGSGHGSGL